ncbi:30S ribosomal protein S12 [Paenibacillus sp. MAHUQ-46]|uniref:30S ribosomal protein S12 n=1 Tax=Paenibacillus roseus TaxID=2798579 RepID=A0A934J2U0_9BACL|nr:30S ribosomal protein S12 [Paenibacillus roseus]MBJ6361755.1 30S ribosomal protein S12 [Paenibacillus roseus]
MATIQQLLHHQRKKHIKKKKNRALKGCPQRKVVCIRCYTIPPKKPNSALRKVARVRFKNNTELVVRIPGIGHTFQEHATGLIRGGRVRDLPGIKYQLIRGARDLTGVVGRKTSRSKYGTKKKVESSF